MDPKKRTDHLRRTRVINLLTDNEVVRVSMAETTRALEEGEEYLDLLHLDAGVRRAPRDVPEIRNALPRNAVQESTWRKLLEILVPPFVEDTGSKASETDSRRKEARAAKAVAGENKKQANSQRTDLARIVARWPRRDVGERAP